MSKDSSDEHLVSIDENVVTTCLIHAMQGSRKRQQKAILLDGVMKPLGLAPSRTFDFDMRLNEMVAQTARHLDVSPGLVDRALDQVMTTLKHQERKRKEAIDRLKKM